MSLLSDFFAERFGATLSNYDKYLAQAERFISVDRKQLKPAEIVDFVYRTPIEELGLQTSAYDEGTKLNSMCFDSS